ncbi:MAG TPA: hypothetical protein DD734_03485 [Firmicutes bacterium]|nr:hypothetical protein [Bacillota bacterium]
MQGCASIATFSARLYQSRKQRFRSREEAAEYMPVCSRLLDDYETGKGVPTADMALAMSEALEDPILRRTYCTTVCPIGAKHQQPVRVDELPQLAIRLVKELQDVVDKQKAFIGISFDGRVESHEIAEFLDFARELRELKCAVEALELWVETELETKKETAIAAI